MAQPLFANQRESNLQSTTALLDEVVGADRRFELPGSIAAWRLEKGSAKVTLALLARPDFTHVRLSAVVMTVDDKVDRLALYTKLLELNAGLCGNAFAVDGNAVLLVAERSTLDLDRSEISDLITRVTTNADNHDDALVAE